ncbi:COMM domain-containing protein 2 isoform X2 [Gadus morhua]|uniref:COMM domain-containing protein n=1 Tax=Gadus morhua TaxID=8049 RepID=A0A8C4Z7Y6_GADMO|nr:COMM domain-containing protein 2 isoform X2 [Gadus morhua]
MLLVLSEEYKEHLAFLPQVDPAVVFEFGRIAVEFLKRGINSKVYDGAARKLGFPITTVQHGVEGLMFLFTESSKLMITDIDFKDSVMVLGFSTELNEILLQLYVENQTTIRSTLTQLAPSLPSYHNLEWRLDVQLGSRSMRHQVVPVVTMLLNLTMGTSENRRCCLQTNPSTLLHLIAVLEAALASMKNNHARRILRNIK